MKRTIALCAALILPAAARAQTVTIMGAGAYQCGHYTALRGPDAAATASVVMAWSQGYLSARARTEGRDILAQATPDQIGSFISNQCRQQPQMKLTTVLDGFVLQQEIGQ